MREGGVFVVSRSLSLWISDNNEDDYLGCLLVASVACLSRLDFVGRATTLVRISSLLRLA